MAEKEGLEPPSALANTAVFKRVQILWGGLAVFHNIHRGDGLRKRVAVQRADKTLLRQ